MTPFKSERWGSCIRNELKRTRGFHTLLFHDVPTAQQENTKRKFETIKTGILKVTRLMIIHTAGASNQL